MKIRILFFLLVCIFSSLAQAQEAGLSSFEKISKAQKEGKITPEMAIGYKFLALQKDAYLPAEFAADEGAINNPKHDQYQKLVMKALPKMPRALAIKVYNYFIPEPFRPSNKSNKSLNLEGFAVPLDVPASNWAFIEDNSSEIRVWYRKDNELELEGAKYMKTVMIEEIIPAIKKLMGRTHMRDTQVEEWIVAEDGTKIKMTNGGDGKLDIYIGPSSIANGITYAYIVEDNTTFGCKSRPSYIVMDTTYVTTASRKRVAGTLAHEYFHVIQNTYDRQDDCGKFTNIDEGTATYIKQHIYPKENHEHDWYEFSEDGSLSLHDASYGSWFFYYWLMRTHGTASMPTLYNNMLTKSPMPAVDSILKGGFKKQWMEYLVQEWNQAPLKEGFFEWDKYKIIPGKGTRVKGHLPPIDPFDIILDESGQFRQDMTMNLKPLTRDYYAFNLFDPNIRSVAIENPGFWNGRKVKTKLLLKKKGSNVYDEVLIENSNRSEQHYCLDKKSDDYEQVVVIVGNYQVSETGDVYQGKPNIKVTNQPCYGLKGKIQSVWHFKEGNVDNKLTVTGTDIEFIEDGHGPEGVFKNRFTATKGKVAWEFNGRMGDCTSKANGIFELRPYPDMGSFTLASYNVAPEGWGYYGVGINFVKPDVMVTFVCPPPKASFEIGVVGTLSTAFGPIPHHRGNFVYKGQNSGQYWTNTWHFEPVTEQ